MKKISLFIAACIALLSFTACDTEDDVVFVVTDATEVAFTNDFLPEYILNKTTPGNLAERFTWNSVDFGVQTNVVYELQHSIDGSFEDAEEVNSTSGNDIAVTIGKMRELAIDAGLDDDPDTENPNTGQLHFRLMASVGTAGGEARYSAIQSLTVVLPETDEIIEEGTPLLAVPGNHQGWSPADAPLLAASGAGQTDYEGFVWLDGGFKFVGPDADGAFAWGNIDWGDDGTFTGKLLEQDEEDCNAETPGFYFVSADTGALTYSFVETNWGVIGDATPTGWDSDTDMVYDNATGLWTLTLDLTAGGHIKFRANDDWNINLGDHDNDGSLEFGGADIPIAESGTYLITLDLRTPRQYTYSLELQ